jgi:hypothetical protein
MGGAPLECVEADGLRVGRGAVTATRPARCWSGGLPGLWSACAPVPFAGSALRQQYDTRDL